MGGAGRTEANSSNSTSLSIRCTRVSKGKFRENISYSHWNHLGTLTGRKSVHRVFRKKKTVLQSAKHDISPVTLTYDQLDAQIFNTFITILYMYMFRAISCSSSGGWIVSTQHLVSSLSVSDRSVHRLRKNFFLNLCTERSLTESDDTRCCIDTIRPPKDEQDIARNMYM